MSSDSPRIVVAGHLCLDVLPYLLENTMTLIPGHLTLAGPITFSTGGAVANTGLALSRLGLSPRLLGKIGMDLFGQTIRQLLSLEAAELTEHLVIASPGEATSYTIILSPPETDRMFIHAPGCNATFVAHDVGEEELQHIQLFHFGYPPLMEQMYAHNGEELVKLFRRVKAAGAITSLDMSMPDLHSAAGRVDWKGFLLAVLPFVDVFLPSIEEMLVMLNRPWFDQLHTRFPGYVLDHIQPEQVSAVGQELLSMGPKIVGLKLGDRGLYLRTGTASSLGDKEQLSLSEGWRDRELWCPCFAVRAIGTTGAGDATIAGFLFGLLKAMEPEEAMRTACATGAYSVEAIDAISAIPRWTEMQARMQSGWAYAPTKTPHEKWIWNNRWGVWNGPEDRRHTAEVQNLS